MLLCGISLQSFVVTRKTICNAIAKRHFCNSFTSAKSGRNIGKFHSFRRKLSDVKIPDRFKKKLPFEANIETVSEKTLLFSCHSMKRNAVLISVGGTFVSLVMAQSADLIYRYSGAVKIQPVEKSPWYLWWLNIDYSSNILKFTMMTIMLIAGEWNYNLTYCVLCQRYIIHSMYSMSLFMLSLK